ncbi:MAG: DUF559 domain-containing protein [Micrococcus sp.]|nr:DUF559 domain-containing protein [Micrococcus sp.]
MPRPRPLPEPLATRPFTRAEALALGLTDKRLRSSDILRLGHGLYASTTAPLGWPSAYETPGHGLGLPALAALQRQYPAATFSHATAAHVFRLPLPGRILADRDVHLTWSPDASRAQRRGIHSHRNRLLPPDRVRFRRLVLTSPARTLIDLASDDRLCGEDLVVIADAIVNRPYRQGDRVDGLDTPAGLAAAVARAGSTPGVRRARRAVDRARVGADSPQETRVRMALVDAGLPEPELQVQGDPADRWSPVADLGYRELKIAIQYDGKHHRSREQQAADAYRDEWFQRHGWLVVRLTWADQAQGFVRLVRLVRERLGTGTDVQAVGHSGRA